MLPQDQCQRTRDITLLLETAVSWHMVSRDIDHINPTVQCAISLLATGYFPTILALWPDNFSIGRPFWFKKLYFMILLYGSVRMAKQSWIWSDKRTCQTTLPYIAHCSRYHYNTWMGGSSHERKSPHLTIEPDLNGTFTPYNRTSRQ